MLNLELVWIEDIYKKSQNFLYVIGKSSLRVNMGLPNLVEEMGFVKPD